MSTTTEAAKEKQGVDQAIPAIKELNAIYDASRRPGKYNAPLPAGRVRAIIAILESSKTLVEAAMDEAHAAGNMPEVLRIMKTSNFIRDEISTAKSNLSLDLRRKK